MFVASCTTHARTLPERGRPNGRKEWRMNRHVYAALITAALAGCGTGGGGSGGPSDPVSPPSSSPPSSGPPESSPPESSPPASSFPTLPTVREVLPSSAVTSRSHEHFRDRVRPRRTVPVTSLSG